MLVMQQAADAGSLVGQRMSKPEFAAGTSLRRFQEVGVVRVGVLADAPGFSSRNGGVSRFEGLDVTIARRLVQSIFGGTLSMTKNNVEFVELSIAERTTALAERSVDVVASVFIPTEERRKLVDFSDSYYGTQMGVVCRPDSPIESVEDLSKASIAITPGTVDETIVASMGLSHRIVECSGIRDVISTVIDGKADAAVMASAVIDGYARRDSGLRRIEPAVDFCSYALGVPKGDDALLDYVNVQVNDMLRQGFVALAEMVRRKDLKLKR